MTEASIPYGLDNFYYKDKFQEEDFTYEHDLYGETYLREVELREFSHLSSYHGSCYALTPKFSSVEDYLRSNSVFEEHIPRGRPIYPRQHMAPTHHHQNMYGNYQQNPMRHHPHSQQVQYLPSNQGQQHHGRKKRGHSQRNGPMPPTGPCYGECYQSDKKFRKKTHKNAGNGKGNSRKRKGHKGKNGQYFKKVQPDASRIRIHGDSWKDNTKGFVGLIGKGGHKIGIYQSDKIDPLLPINNQNKNEEDKHTSMKASNFNTYHAGAFWRLFGVEVDNVEDFRQTVGDKIIGFAVRPDGDVVVKSISFAAKAYVNIIKVLDIFEDMRENGFRSRTVEELTTKGTIQAIVEQWMDGKKVIEMSL